MAYIFIAAEEGVYSIVKETEDSYVAEGDTARMLIGLVEVCSIAKVTTVGHTINSVDAFYAIINFDKKTIKASVTYSAAF